MIKYFKSLDNSTQAVIARMYFRKRIWFKLVHLKSYGEGFIDNKNADHIENMLQRWELVDSAETALANERAAIILLNDLTLNELKMLLKQLNNNLKCKLFSF